MMNVPKEMKGKIQEISPQDLGMGRYRRQIHTWGYTRITAVTDLGNIPEEVSKANIKNTAIAMTCGCH